MQSVSESAPRAEPDPASAERWGEPDACRNCDAARVGAYCHECGQHFVEEGRLTLGRLWRELAARFLSLERGFFHTFGRLFVDPGGLARRYVHGERRRHVNPLTYLFIASTVTLLTFPLNEEIMVEYFMADMQRQFAAGGNMEENLARVLGDDPARTIAAGIVGMVKRFYTYLSLLYVIPLAVLLHLFFKGAGPRYNLAENTVFALYVMGHVILVTGLVGPLLIRLSVVWYSRLVIVSYGLYCAWAALGFYERRPRTVLLSLLAFAGMYGTFIVLMMLAAALYFIINVL